MNHGSHEIFSLLNQKHGEKFVCIPECKTGSAGSRVIDFWCMAKSWAHPKVIAYEIKVNRQDFIRDDKWPRYLPYCNEFYFAAPQEIISPDELPPEAGLVLASKNMKRLFIKKKAPYRNIDIKDSVFRYILMWRSRITADQNDRLEYWKNWLAEKDERKTIGHLASTKIQKLIRQRIFDVEAKNAALQQENAALSGIKGFLDELGISASSYRARQMIKDRVDESRTRIPKDIENNIATAFNALKIAMNRINDEQ